MQDDDAPIIYGGLAGGLYKRARDNFVFKIYSVLSRNFTINISAVVNYSANVHPFLLLTNLF